MALIGTNMNIKYFMYCMLLHWNFCICKVDNVTTDKNIVLKIYVGRGGVGGVNF